MLSKRIGSGLLLGALAALAAFVGPVGAVWAVMTAMVIVAQREFYHLLDAAGIPAFRVIGCVVGTILMTIVFLALVPYGACRVWTELDAAEWTCLVLFLLVFVICVRQFPQKDNPQPLNTIACTIFGVLYVPFLFSFFVRLLYSWDAPPGWFQKAGMAGGLLFFYLIVVVKMTDIGAFFVGRRLGRHKMFPRISPGKTWEGTAGGIATGTLASVVYFLLARHSTGPGPWHLGRLDFGLHDVIILGILLSGVGVVGDLVESLLKRAGGAKDSGQGIPGMGGLLDVLDSLLLTAAVLYYYMRFFVSAG